MRRISKGEEILFCYSRLSQETRSRARRAYLQVIGNNLRLFVFTRKNGTLQPQELYHFTCDCPACDQSEEEEEEQEREWQRRRELERQEEMREAELFLETFPLDLLD